MVQKIYLLMALERRQQEATVLAQRTLTSLFLKQEKGATDMDVAYRIS